MSNSSGEPKREYQLRQESGQLSREVISRAPNLAVQPLIVQFLRKGK